MRIVQYSLKQLIGEHGDGVIHKTVSARHIPTPPEQDRVTAVANTRRKSGEDRACSSGDMLARLG